MMAERRYSRHELTRRYLAAGSIMIMPAIFVAAWLQWHDNLPNILPTHWDASGTPDGFTDTLTYTIILASVLALVTILGLVASMSRRWPAGTERFWLAAAGSVQGMATALWVVSAIVTINHGDPETAPLGPWLFLVIAAIAWGAVPALIHPPSPAPRTRVNEPVMDPDVPAEPWSETVSSGIMVALAILMTGIGIAFVLPFILTGDGWMLFTGITLLIAGFPIAMIAKYRISIDESGFRATSALFGIAFKKLRLDQIEKASAGEIVPAEWGGWGWRVMPGRSALVMNRGLGIMVRDTSGKEFAANLTGAHEAAATLNAYLVQKG